MGMQRVGHDLVTKQQQLAPLGNEGHVLKVMVPGSVGTKPRHCPSGVDLHIVLSWTNIQISSCALCLSILDPQEKQKGQTCKGPILQ